MTKKRKKIQPFAFLLGVILAVYSLILFGMLYITVITSLKDIADFALNPFGWPERLMFSNYSKAFSSMYVPVPMGSYSRKVYLWEMLLNSVIYAGGCAVTSTIVPCLVAYLVAKYKCILNKFVYGAVIVAMILPIVGSLPSEIAISRALHLYDNVVGLWIMKANFLGMYFLVFYSTFKSLSSEYGEAAEVDGAGHFTVMIKVMFPLVRTTIFAVMILQFITFWNDYQIPLVYLPSFPTAAVGLFTYAYMGASGQSSSVPMQMAGCLVLFLPIFIVFLLFRNAFMGNLTMGGIKG